MPGRIIASTSAKGVYRTRWRFPRRLRWIGTSGAHVYTGSATFSGTGAMTASGRLLARGTVVLSAHGDATAQARLIARGVATASGLGDLGADGRLIAEGVTAFSAHGDMTAIGRLMARASAALSGTGAMSALARLIARASAALSGTGTFTAHEETAVQPPTRGGGGTPPRLVPVGRILPLAVDSRVRTLGALSPILVLALAVDGEVALASQPPALMRAEVRGELRPELARVMITARPALQQSIALGAFVEAPAADLRTIVYNEEQVRMVLRLP